MAIVSVVAACAVLGTAVATGFFSSGKRAASAVSHPSPPPTGPTLATTVADSRTWTAIENAKAGSADWALTHPSRNGEIEGYAGVVSATRGDTVTLYVTSSASTWTATAYRMGWYGGQLAREIWKSVLQVGVTQPASTRDDHNTVTTQWSPSLQVTVGVDWPPGDYLFKLVSSTGWDSYIPLTVRDDDSRSPVLIVNSVTTWQAYNLWGGYDLYRGPTPDPAANRATIVSFDRPYQLGNGSGDFLGNEMPFVKLAESQGLDVSYTTNVDVDQHAERILRHRVMVSLGHDEYWSTAMRDGVELARDTGVNLLFLGANAVYRHIRFQPSPLGTDRLEVNYRVAASDPEVNPAEVTVEWRYPPVSKPESTLLGEMYECNPVKASFVTGDARAWIYAGTGLKTGARLTGVVGSEYDHWSPFQGGPPVELMARSPVVCRGHSSTSDFTYYVAPSGAGVIDTGTNLWVPSLDDPAVAGMVGTITMTIVRAFSTGPAGRLHPAVATHPQEGVPRGGTGASTTTVAPDSQSQGAPS